YFLSAFSPLSLRKCLSFLAVEEVAKSAETVDSRLEGTDQAAEPSRRSFGEAARINVNQRLVPDVAIQIGVACSKPDRVLAEETSEVCVVITSAVVIQV